MSRSVRPYSGPAYLLRASLRRRFTSAGAVAWLRGLPRPTIRPGSGRIDVGDVALYPGVHLSCGDEGSIAIGDGTYLNRGAEVIAWESVSIGRDCMIGWDVVILDTDLHPVEDRPLRDAPVVIEDRVWIGCRAIVLKGVTLGEGCIVSAGTIVTRDVEPYTIVAGEPAREVGRVDPAQKEDS